MTNKIQIAEDNKIEAEAAAWIAQLHSGDVSPNDLSAFKEWMARSPQHEKEIKELAAIWGELDSLTQMAEPIRAAALSERKLLRPQQRYRVLQTGLALSVLVAGFIWVGSIFWNGNDVSAPIRVAKTIVVPVIVTTKVGAQKTQILSDGSKITLNTDTHIEIEFDTTHRIIRLLKGEAVFDVEHDENRPFLVYAGDGVVRAVGTVFVIHLKKNVLDLTVTDGAVELSAVNMQVDVEGDVTPVEKVTGFVKSGHEAQLVEHKAIIVPISTVDIKAKTSWQQGLLSFSGESLETVVFEISRYTTLEIEIRDPAIRDMRIGGVFKTGDIDALFEALEAGFAISVERPSENVIYLKQDTGL
ncbi:MAG: hypothetical protein COA43_05890 [Robiginitomaculum sp.]|nr:MAG: hypothetical protein COA43_05890 [Robiginitomaculum sp.]